MNEKILSLEVCGEGFLLVQSNGRGHRSTMLLSEHDLLLLPRVIQQALAQIQAARTVTAKDKAGAILKVAVPVVNAELNVGSGGESLLLMFLDSFGNEAGFALPVDLAIPLGARMSARAHELRSSAKVRNSN